MSDKFNIHKDDLDDIIEIASLLQEKEKQNTHISLEEVEAVAIELDISPEKVQEALEFLNETRSKEKQAEEERQQANKKIKLWMTGILTGIILCIGMVLLALAISADSSVAKLDIAVSQKQSQFKHKEAQLKNAIDRQAKLIPQLLAMMGGEVDSLGSLQQQVLQEDELSEKMNFSNQLGIEIAKTIGTLPPSKNDSDNTTRLQYQYEVTGAQNRISTEKKRYDETKQEWNNALQDWKDGTSGLGPRLAMMLGWVKQRPE